MIPFDIQPILAYKNIVIKPIESDDFEALFNVASDPQIWEQHPCKDRWKREVFQGFFDTAIQSKGAFKIIDTKTDEIIGSTRFYDYDFEKSAIRIGFTFYARRYWGNGTNFIVKKLMLNYIFQFVSSVNFQIGAENIRSQIAIQRLGALKIDEAEVCYMGEEKSNLNFIYLLTKENWEARNRD